MNNATLDTVASPTFDPERVCGTHCFHDFIFGDNHLRCFSQRPSNRTERHFHRPGEDIVSLEIKIDDEAEDKSWVVGVFDGADTDGSLEIECGIVKEVVVFLFVSCLLLLCTTTAVGITSIFSVRFATRSGGVGGRQQL